MTDGFKIVKLDGNLSFTSFSTDSFPSMYPLGRTQVKLLTSPAGWVRDHLRGIEAGNGGNVADTKTMRETPAAAAS
eukprot:766456-Hanusia_phi.AAC.1